MKLNPLEWSEIKTNEEIIPASGVLQLRASAPFAVFVTSHGVESTQLVSSSARFVLPPETTYKVISEGRVFVKDTPRRIIRMTGRKFTNIDRKPGESGSYDAVAQAVRQMAVDRHLRMLGIRAKRDEALVLIEAEQTAQERAAAVAAKAAAEQPKPEPEPAKPDPEPAK